MNLEHAGQDLGEPILAICAVAVQRLYEQPMFSPADHGFRVRLEREEA